MSMEPDDTGPLCLASVTHRRLQLRPRCGTCRYFLPANGQTVLHAMKALAFLCPLTGCWMSGLVPTFRLPRTAPMCVYVHPRTVFVWTQTPAFPSPRDTPCSLPTTPCFSPQYPTRRTLCSSDQGCKKGWMDPQSKGTHSASFGDPGDGWSGNLVTFAVP